MILRTMPKIALQKDEPKMPEQTLYTLRPYVGADAHQVVEVVNAATLRVRAGRGAEIDSTGNVHLAGWYVPVASERVVVIGPQDKVIAFAYFSAEAPNIVSATSGTVHPDFQGAGVGSLLLDWAETRAREFSHRAPKGVRTILETNAFEVEQEAIRLFIDRGYVRDARVAAPGCRVGCAATTAAVA